MRMNKKKAWIGYHPRAVEQLVQEMQEAFEQEKRRLEEEVAEWTAGNDELKQRISLNTRLLMERRQASISQACVLPDHVVRGEPMPGKKQAN